MIARMTLEEEIGAGDIKLWTDSQLVISQIIWEAQDKDPLLQQYLKLDKEKLESSRHLKSLTSIEKRTLGPMYFPSWQAQEALN